MEIFFNSISALGKEYQPYVVIVAAIMIIACGILNMLPGEESKTKARKWLPNIFLGIGLVLLAFVVAQEWADKFSF